LVQYYIDEGDGLPGPSKGEVGELLSELEGRSISQEEFSLCPSATCATLVVLASLKALGVSTIRFETPTYYAPVEQTDAFELHREMIPTFYRDGYSVCRELAVSNAPQMPLALWMTQPRFAIGFDQPRALLGAILEELAQTGSYLVVDEVMDQSFPAHLAQLGTTGAGKDLRLIRIRSFLKAAGINGIRLSVILHSPSMRPHIVNALEMFGGGVDAFSLAAISRLAQDRTRYGTMLRAANAQVNRLRVRAERMLRGTPLHINSLRNGYVGSMVADVSRFGSTWEERRANLLEGCRRVRTPIVLGASFYVALDPPNETIRLNFFTPPDELLRGISNVLGLWK
jgi:DNA-binding transcriptional MocR family regulator